MEWFGSERKCSPMLEPDMFLFVSVLLHRLVVNSRDPIIRAGATHQPALNQANKNMRDFPLNTVQTLANNFPAPLRAPAAPSSSNDWQLHARLSFIEHQLRLCESVGTAVELEHWYAVLGGHLAEHGPERRIRLLLDELMGVPPALRNGEQRQQQQQQPVTVSLGVNSSSNDKTGGGSSSNVGGEASTSHRYLGLIKHRLLQRILDKLQTAPRWQRIYMEYSEQLMEQQHGDAMDVPET